MDEFSPRQLCALLLTALSAPLAIVCASVSWVWILAAAVLAGLFYLYIVGVSRKLPKGLGYAELLQAAWGRWAGAALAVLYWAWLVLSAARAARMAELAFPQDRAFPLIPLVLLLLAALVAARSTATACRFGGVLFLFVAALQGFTLIFGAAGIELENLAPAGDRMETLRPLAVLLLPVAGLFLRDRLDGQRGHYLRWYLLAAGLALAAGIVCTGSLGLPLAKATPDAFWLMSRSISVFGVMERFEALISGLLSLGFCCLLTLLLLSARKALCSMVPELALPAAVWIGTAATVGALWIVPVLPERFWFGGALVFWVTLPLWTLGSVWIKEGRGMKKGLDDRAERCYHMRALRGSPQSEAQKKESERKKGKS